MPKYLVQASYSAEGTKGLLTEGGSKRRAVAAELIQKIGGKLEAFYFAFGDTDAFLIVEAPDNASVAAISLTVGASGAIHLKTTPLLTPEEIDQATKKGLSYRAPGR